MRRAARMISLVLGVALVCAGCGSSTELAADRARTLQDSVLAVSQAASEARWADAQSLLVETRVALDDGVDAGEVSTTRYREIDAALDLVATELAASRAAADQAAAEAAAAAQAAAEQAAAEQAAAEQEAAPPPAKEPPAPKGKGPGKGK
ncbi:hypothetical protein [Cellulomonas humilata]|uniref:Mucin-associated surface protein n=1 Tax=Cellulomonas humilata TaxID=144055 RepID=A0ABU0ED00_9CELL|nr:hypothetical protein [Cellulomonas humilata]MDQ0373145.1 hypothetical protein [Cellulomonas humilata]